MKLYFIAILFLVNTALAYAADGGSICIGPMPGEKAYTDMPMSMAPSYVGSGETLTIRIGDKEMSTSPTSGGRIDGLSLENKHLIQIKRDNTTIVSFWFDFKKENANALCLWYKKGYGTFTLFHATDKLCKCPPPAPP